MKNVLSVEFGKYRKVQTGEKYFLQFLYPYMFIENQAHTVYAIF